MRKKLVHLITFGQRVPVKRTHRRFFISILLFLAVGYLFFTLFRDLPSPTRLKSLPYPVSTKIFDRDGQLLYEIYGEQKRTPVKLEDIPQHLKEATIAIEDKDFYRHQGFSLRGISRALFNIVFHQRLEGGSTITQQLVKNALLTPKRTLRRKIREAVLTLATEALYSKDEILQMYFNQVPYGGEAWGIGAAAEKYFAKKAAELNLAEAALLAGLPRAPTHYSPFGAHPERAKWRQKQVLQRMAEEGYITEEEKEKAAEKKLELAAQRADIKAPHFVMFIKEILVERFGQKMVEQGGLRVKTTLDWEIQKMAQETVREEIEGLANLKVSNGAALVTEPASGQILAMVGSRDYWAEEIDGKVNVTLALRQPGSAIKPINYSLGFLNGYTPATVLLDVPTCFQIPGQPLYCPKNYDGKFRGPIQVRFALGSSINVPAVKMLYLNGVEEMIKLAEKMGITTWEDRERFGLSLTLGGGEVKMTEMATAFGVLANAGVRVDLNPILEVKNHQGKNFEFRISNFEFSEQRVLPMEVAYLITHILLDNNARTPAFGANSLLKIPGHPEVAVKTGTTQNLRDNWTIGYTQDYLTAVWVGNNDNQPMSWVASGVTGATPIWHRIMRELLTDQPQRWPPKPEKIVGRSICSLSGQLKNPQSPCQERFEFFIQGKAPTQTEALKRPVEVDKTTGQLATEDTPPENREIQEHPVVQDPLGSLYCLDCPPPDKPLTLQYP